LVCCFIGEFINEKGLRLMYSRNTQCFCFVAQHLF